ncbi:MAG TPA: ABC transporter ATP-binding protein [Candidatus Limnocylindrales bacterium]|jgi:ABC-2 type transport system ATP-binding protein
MTAPSTRPIRRKGTTRQRSTTAPGEPGATGRPHQTGDDRPRAPIRTRGLTKVYGELVAVDHLDLEVQAGEIFGLLGQNGAGKTTTILMLLGLTEPTEGQARVVGLDPARRPLEVKRRVGYLPDAVGFYGDLTGRQNLRYTAQLNRIPRDEANATIDEVLEQVGLSARADDPAETYSRGMLQRLGIADALVKDPDVLILDEPTTAIDPLGVTEILDLLRTLVRDRSMAVLLSSHLLNQVQHVCDRIGIFAAGRLIGQGSMPELAKRFGEDVAHIEAEFDASDEAGDARVREVLAGIPNVTNVASPSAPGTPWTIEVRPAQDEIRVRRAILAASSSLSLDLTSIGTLPPSLEELYRRAVERAAHGHARDVR